MLLSNPCRDGQNTGAVRDPLKTELREFSFELVYDKVDFIVIPFVTHILLALFQLASVFKGDITDQNLSAGVQMILQNAQEGDLLFIRQMMQEVGRYLTRPRPSTERSRAALLCSHRQSRTIRYQCRC